VRRERFRSGREKEGGRRKGIHRPLNGAQGLLGCRYEEGGGHGWGKKYRGKEKSSDTGSIIMVKEAAAACTQQERKKERKRVVAIFEKKTRWGKKGRNCKLTSLLTLNPL